MNLHGIAGPIVAAVNPPATAMLSVSTGTTTSGPGKQIPTYDAPVPVTAQVQALGYKDLMQVAGLNLNGTRRAIYLYGTVQGVNRAENKGGDLVAFTSGPLAGTTWLVAMVLEQWGSVENNDLWCKVAVTQQVS